MTTPAMTTPATTTPATTTGPDALTATTQEAPTTPRPVVDLDDAWTLSPAVALRPEPFGALAYHFGNRRLTFLKRPELVVVVRALQADATVRNALEQAEVAPARWPAFLEALASLAATDMIRRQPMTGDR